MTDNTTGPALSIERVGASDYIARNSRGAELRAGGTSSPGAFAPGELLQLALGTCILLSADHTLASKLGDDFTATVDVSATKTDDGYQYDHILGRVDQVVSGSGGRVLNGDATRGL